MKCPCCGKEMLSGYLYNGSQPLQWIPENKRPSMLSFSVAESAVSLRNRFSPIRVGGYQAEAYHCPVCKLVLAPTE